MNRLGEALAATGPASVDLLFVYNANPLMTIPAQEKVRAGLSREDLFTVVFDPVLTDTARYADVVLPAATFLERREISRGYGALVLQDARGRGSARRRGAAEPRGLRRALPPDGRGAAGRSRDGGGARRRLLRFERAGAGSCRPRPRRREPVASLAGGATPVQFVDVFPQTADGRIHLVPEALDREAPGGLYAYRADPGTARFPLALISPADRPHDQLDPRGAASRPGPARDPSRTTPRPAESRDGEPRARLQRARRGPVPRPSRRAPCDPASCSCPRGSGATTPRAARRPLRSRRIR